MLLSLAHESDLPEIRLFRIRLHVLFYTPRAELKEKFLIMIKMNKLRFGDKLFYGKLEK